jgi:hypothetical protein
MNLSHHFFRASLALLPALLACESAPKSAVTRQHLKVEARGPAEAPCVEETLARVKAAHALDPNAEHPGDAPAGVVLDWEHAEELSEGRVALSAINLDDEPFELRVTAIGDLATMASRKLGAPVNAAIPAKGSLRVEVELDAAAMADMEYSGFFAVHVSACPLREEGELSCRTSVSAARFFHPVGDAIAVYGEEQLAAKHQNGDFRGLNKDQALVPGTFRVMGGGPLHTPSPREIDEPREQDRPIIEIPSEGPAIPAVGVAQ